MRYKFILFCFIIFFSTHYSFSSELNKIKDTEILYKQQNYELALENYLMLIEKYPNNANLLFNTANTYFKLNSMGFAIGYYLKALNVNPNEKDYIYNLNLARKFTQYEKDEKKESLINSFLSTISKVKYTTTKILFLISLSFLLTSIFLLLKKSHKKELFTNLTSISIVFLIITSLLFGIKLNQSKKSIAVVTNKKIAAHSGPSDKLSTLFYIHEGKECEIKSHDKNWAEIKLSNGFIGWVKINSLFLIQ